jgi:hypothetical protein
MTFMILYLKISAKLPDWYLALDSTGYKFYGFNGLGDCGKTALLKTDSV